MVKYENTKDEKFKGLFGWCYFIRIFSLVLGVIEKSKDDSFNHENEVKTIVSSSQPTNREINHEVPQGPNPIGNSVPPPKAMSDDYSFNREINHEVPHGPNPIGNPSLINIAS